MIFSESDWFIFLRTNALWLSVNVAVPVLLPYLMLVLIAIDQATHGPGKRGTTTWRKLLKKSVDTGQLFWTAISMVAAIAYDAIGAWDKHPDQRAAVGGTIMLCILLGFICTVLVGFSTLRSAKDGTTNWYVIGISIVLTTSLCIFYPIIHFKFSHSC